mgnify:CR=1 FL=1
MSAVEVYKQVSIPAKEFVDYARSRFPSARVAIGCLYRRILDATLDGINIGYETCKKYGAEYIHDTQALCCLPDYFSTDGTHLTAAGYAFYQPYINQAILTSACAFDFEYTSQATGAPENWYMSLARNQQVTFKSDSKVYHSGNSPFVYINTQNLKA